MEMEQGPILDSLCIVKRVDPSLSHEDEYRTMSVPHKGKHKQSILYTNYQCLLLRRSVSIRDLLVL